VNVEVWSFNPKKHIFSILYHLSLPGSSIFVTHHYLVLERAVTSYSIIANYLLSVGHDTGHDAGSEPSTSSDKPPHHCQLSTVGQT
jgi:hypothetical protein